jgi:phosphate transport system substrate-binding protein
MLLALQMEAFGASEVNDKRSNIYIVGSSTISPLMAAVSEEFSRVASLKGSPIKTPIVESSGSRAGINFFCLGVGLQYPDFVNASRPMESGEIMNCKRNGIKNILEIKLGYDGIVFADFAKSSSLNLTKEQIFAAVAKHVVDKKTGEIIKNPYNTWNQIDSALPNDEIVIYGPPSSSGTRDVFVEMLMEKVCLEQKEFVAAYKDQDVLRDVCSQIRNDGRFIESGENDNLIINNLKNNHNAIGIVGFNFLVANSNVIKAVAIDGVVPNKKTISLGKYPLSRPLFVYFKKEHLNLIPQNREFIKEIINSQTIGNNGYLVHSGLVPMSIEELQKMQKEVLSKIKN